MIMTDEILREELSVQALLGLLKLKYEGSSPPNRNKKSALQNRVLRYVFRISMYPSLQTKIDLSILLNLSVRSISVWFQNERQGGKQVSKPFDYIRACRCEINALILYRIYDKASKENKRN